MKPDLPFSRSDFTLRLGTARRVLQEREIDCAVLMGPEVQYWLCGHDSFLGALLPQALILTPDDRSPVMVVWDADAAIARHTSILDDIRTYRFGVDDPAELFVQIAQGRALQLKRIAIDLASRAVPYGFGSALTRLLAGMELVDGSDSMARLRAVKSPAELNLKWPTDRSMMSSRLTCARLPAM